MFSFAISGGNLTLFAPTNGAFSAIASSLPELSAPGAKDIYIGKNVDSS